jgi:mannan endo-1,4-beta-mannosidase
MPDVPCYHPGASARRTAVRMRWAAALAAAMVAGGLLVEPARALPGAGDERERFVRRIGSRLELRGSPFRVVGASNYYLMYKSPLMVDAVLQAAAASGFNVMRVWGSIEIGREDGSESIHGKADGAYFQYWNGAAPAYNDGPDGLQRLDYVVYRASQLGIRLVIPFVNNWNDFGGMDQYVRWRGGRYHDDFYTDSLVREWYLAWIGHLLNRVNTYTGVAYKDDPTILMWELANEPRCRGTGTYPASPHCTTQTLIEWAAEASAFVKSLAPDHLLSIGDEGFFCFPGADDWTADCSEGVDTLALAALPGVDVASFHLYPEQWGQTPDWGTRWIRRHLRNTRRLGDRVYLGEFGLRDRSIRNRVYKEWTDAILASGGSGAISWMLADRQDDGTPYPDFDGFTVYCPSPVCTTLGNFAARLLRGGSSHFPPVADHDEALTDGRTSVTVSVMSNDVAFGAARILPGSIDLDPHAPGRQTAWLTEGGSFVLEPDGDVTFTPAAGFRRPAKASYIVRDTRRAYSNTATISVYPAGAWSADGLR